MSLLFIEYPKCTTCQRAKKWLEARGVGFQARHIVEAPPTREELAAWAESGCGTPAARSTASWAFPRSCRG